MSPAQACKRALVTILLELARAYGLTLALNRDSPDAVVTSSYRRIMLKVHPDKPNGSQAGARRVNDAYDKWNKANKTSKNGRPKSEGTLSQAMRKKKEYRIQSAAVMFTYQGLASTASWDPLLEFVRTHIKPWGVKHWAATLESNEDGTLHAHLMIQFHRAADRGLGTFVFQGVRPNAATNDYTGESFWGKRPQQSCDRGFFYVLANKIGTQTMPDGRLCVDGDYQPCWAQAMKKYRVLGKWAQTLWQDRKLTHEQYEEYLFLCRDGVISRKRNLESVVEWEESKQRKAEIAERTERIRNNPDVYRPFPEGLVPAAHTWLQGFQQDAVRYAILLVLGPSHSGKTEWAQSLFKNPLVLEVRSLTHFPEKMRSFNRRAHDAVILDDLDDLLFLEGSQDKLQGKYNKEVEFASTQGGTCAYWKDLYAVPFVATANGSTKNLDALDKRDMWLGKQKNRIVVNWPPPGFNLGA